MKSSRLFSMITMAGVLALVSISCDDSETEVLTTQNDAMSVTDKGAKSLKGQRETNYSFTGEEGDPITLDLARLWVENYREENPGATEAHFFGNEILDQLLNESGCVGIRVYYALDGNGDKQLVLVGVDEDGNNILPITSNAVMSGEAIVADMSFPCPSFCPDLQL